MTSFLNKIKEKVTRHHTSAAAAPASAPQEPPKDESFTIQPHPAKTNDPADLSPPQTGGGLSSDPVMAVHNAKGPYVPSPEIASSLGQPLSREELRAKQEELNK